MPKAKQRLPQAACPTLPDTVPPGGEIVFDTAFVARMLDRLIAGRVQDLDLLRSIAQETASLTGNDTIHQRLLALARSAREAHTSLMESREILVGLHKQAASGGMIAAIDAITGLPNRDAFSARLSESLKDLPPARTISLMLVEIGALQAVVSEVGLTIANRVLKRFAAVLRRAVKRSDFVARIGPQHFAVIFEDVLPEKIIPIALRVHDVIEARLSPSGEPLASLLSVSMGIAGASGPSSTGSDLMSRAYEAIGQGKKEGRPTIYVA